MAEWDNKEYEKYHPLPLAIVSAGLSLDLFPIEADARGYCSTNVKLYLMR